MEKAQAEDEKSAFIPGGYILLARKLLSSELMEKPPLVLKLWIWMLLQAFFKDHGGLKRGQFFTRLKDIQKAMSYKVGFRNMKPTIKEIRGSVKTLVKSRMMGTTKVTHGQIITISNYNIYQNPGNYEGQSEGQSEGHTKGTILRRKDRKKGKTLSEISDEISALVSKIFSFPGGEETYSKTIQAISQTRKTGKISQGIILSFLKNLEKHSQEKVRGGIQIYLERAYHTQGKGEKYLLGIIRNYRAGEGNPPQELKSTGSALLDDFYRKHSEKGAAQ
jgi:hypothetical protein